MPRPPSPASGGAAALCLLLLLPLVASQTGSPGCVGYTECCAARRCDPLDPVKPPEHDWVAAADIFLETGLDAIGKLGTAGEVLQGIVGLGMNIYRGFTARDEAAWMKYEFDKSLKKEGDFLACKMDNIVGKAMNTVLDYMADAEILKYNNAVDAYMTNLRGICGQLRCLNYTSYPPSIRNRISCLDCVVASDSPVPECANVKEWNAFAPTTCTAQGGFPGVCDTDGKCYRYGSRTAATQDIGFGYVKQIKDELDGFMKVFGGPGLPDFQAYKALQAVAAYSKLLVAQIAAQTELVLLGAGKGYYAQLQNTMETGVAWLTDKWNYYTDAKRVSSVIDQFMQKDERKLTFLAQGKQGYQEYVYSDWKQQCNVQKNSDAGYKYTLEADAVYARLDWIAHKNCQDTEGYLFRSFSQQKLPYWKGYSFGDHGDGRFACMPDNLVRGDALCDCTNCNGGYLPDLQQAERYGIANADCKKQLNNLFYVEDSDGAARFMGTPLYEQLKKNITQWYTPSSGKGVQPFFLNQAQSEIVKAIVPVIIVKNALSAMIQTGMPSNAFGLYNDPRIPYLFSNCTMPGGGIKELRPPSGTACTAKWPAPPPSKNACVDYPGTCPSFASMLATDIHVPSGLLGGAPSANTSWARTRCDRVARLNCPPRACNSAGCTRCRPDQYLALAGTEQALMMTTRHRGGFVQRKGYHICRHCAAPVPFGHGPNCVRCSAEKCLACAANWVVDASTGRCRQKTPTDTCAERFPNCPKCVTAGAMGLVCDCGPGKVYDAGQRKCRVASP